MSLGLLNGVPPTRPNIPREDVPKGANLCEHCTAKCCRYIALPLPRKPKTWGDFDEIRWFLTHQDINIFVDDGEWYLLVHRTCQYLQADYRCGIYETRPQICRTYTTDECEYDEHYLYDQIFEHDNQMLEFAESILGPREAAF